MFQEFNPDELARNLKEEVLALVPISFDSHVEQSGADKHKVNDQFRTEQTDHSLLRLLDFPELLEESEALQEAEKDNKAAFDHVILSYCNKVSLHIKDGDHCLSILTVDCVRDCK